MLTKIFIGYDPKETVAWHVMAHSIYSRSSVPVALIPLNRRNLGGIYRREPDARQSNEFSYTRFLTPYLSGFEGTAVYFDCDMLMRVDISKLLEESRIEDHAIAVVKHDYTPRSSMKYLNNVQYTYPRKNWSSVIVWNCAHPANRVLTPDFINTQAPAVLHRFSWLDDSLIGSLDIRWNWLVGEYDDAPDNICNLHWTIGGPYFNEYRDTAFSQEWFDEQKKVLSCQQREELIESKI